MTFWYQTEHNATHILPPVFCRFPPSSRCLEGQTAFQGRRSSAWVFPTGIPVFPLTGIILLHHTATCKHMQSSNCYLQCHKLGTSFDAIYGAVLERTYSFSLWWAHLGLLSLDPRYVYATLTSSSKGPERGNCMPIAILFSVSGGGGGEAMCMQFPCSDSTDDKINVCLG